MTLNIPYGEGVFKLDDTTKPYTLPTNLIYTVKENDNIKVELARSKYTGKLWAKIRQVNKSWGIVIVNMTASDYDDYIMYYKGKKDITFTPHIDEPAITYTCHVIVDEHNYDKGSYYRDSVILKIIEVEYK